MSNIEYYTDHYENKSAPEFKEFKAEEYQKGNEHFLGVNEIKSFNNESFDHSPPGEKDEGRGQKEKNNDKKTRSKLKKILDSLSKTVAKATSTVVGAAAVGVGAVIALSPLFTPEPIKEPDPISVSLLDFDVGGNYMLYELDVSGLRAGADYDIVISSKKDSFLYDEVTNGTNKEFVLGLSENENYTLSVIEKTDGDSFIHYEKDFSTNGAEIIHESFQATLEAPETNNVTVEWHEDKNTITLPAVFVSHTDSNYKYRVNLTNEKGDIVSTYKGNEGTISLDVPIDADEISITYQSIYDTGSHEIVYSTQTNEENLILKAPEIEFSDEKKLLYAGYYDLTYKVSSTIPDLEVYNSLAVKVNGVDFESYFTPSDINQEKLFTVEFLDPVDEFDIEATLTLNGAYGGNLRTVTYKKHYVNELEFYDSAYYSSSTGNVEFHFIHSEIGGYVLIKDDINSTEERIDTEYHSYPLTGASQYTYALYDKAGVRLTEEKTVQHESISAPSYTFNYTNPGEVLITANEDSTLNFYFETDFVSDNPMVYYEIIMTSGLDEFVFTSRESFIAIENLPNEQYALKFRVVYEPTASSIYEIYNVTPSGTTSFPSGSTVDYSLLDAKTVQFEFYSSTLIDGEIKVNLDGKDYVFTSSDLIYNGYSYTLTLSTDGDSIQSFEFSASVYYKGPHDYMLELYKDQIKGTPFGTQIITY